MSGRRPDHLVAEVPKTRTDAYRVAIESERAGRLIRIAVVHRFAGGQSEVPGQRLAIRPEHIDGLVAALLRAKAAALGERVVAALSFLDSNPS